jgi:hypothetical protein
MFKTALTRALVATLLVCAIAEPALAQPTQVFVAAQGSDGNPCTFTQPCRTFQRAHDTVAADGEIDALNPGSYGLLTISKSISIQGHGFAGIMAPGPVIAITINAAPSAQINLRGLLIDGGGSGGFGIEFDSGASLNIQACLIRHFLFVSAGVGINFKPTTPSSLFVSDTLISDNGLGAGSGLGHGIVVQPFSTVSGILDRVRIENNTGDGLEVFGSANASAGAPNITISDTVVANNGGKGIYALSSNFSALPAVVMVRNSTIVNNGGGGLVVEGSGTTLRVTRSTITRNATGFAAVSSGTLLSYGDNNVDGNTNDGTPTNTIATK